MCGPSHGRAKAYTRAVEEREQLRRPQTAKKPAQQREFSSGCNAALLDSECPTSSLSICAIVT